MLRRALHRLANGPAWRQQATRARQRLCRPLSLAHAHQHLRICRCHLPGLCLAVRRAYALLIACREAVEEGVNFQDALGVQGYLPATHCVPCTSSYYTVHAQTGRLVTVRPPPIAAASVVVSICNPVPHVLCPGQKSSVLSPGAYVRSMATYGKAGGVWWWSVAVQAVEPPGTTAHLHAAW